MKKEKQIRSEEIILLSEEEMMMRKRCNMIE